MAKSISAGLIILLALTIGAVGVPTAHAAGAASIYSENTQPEIDKAVRPLKSPEAA
jgi:hypothetical protein